MKNKIADLEEGQKMELTTVRIEKPETTNFILGQSHFIKTVEDIHEVMVSLHKL